MSEIEVDGTFFRYTMYNTVIISRKLSVTCMFHKRTLECELC